MRVITLPGTTIASWPGVEVWRLDQNGRYSNVTAYWNFSDSHHHHYEVRRMEAGSYYCPVSTTPPQFWQNPVRVDGTQPEGNQPVNPNGSEYRPTGTYFWIPRNAIPGNIVPGVISNDVVCNCPDEYPPSNDHLMAALPSEGVQALNASTEAQTRLYDAFDHLSQIMAVPRAAGLAAAATAGKNAFEDSDGLMSFVNLSSSFVTGNDEFLTGRDVCDKIASYFATVRQNVYSAQIRDPKRFILEGDGKPKDQWDSPVTHKLQKMLIDAGGLSSFKVVTETYSNTQLLAEFSTDFVKLIFDATVVPAAIIESVAKFLQGVGSTLRTSWDHKERTFSTTLLGQCHEAVPIDSTGSTTVYLPKVKFFRIEVTADQKAFTTPCSKLEKITFDFKYESYVAALKHTVLDKTSSDYKDFTAFLNKAQSTNYKDATNNLDAILEGTVSGGGSGARLMSSVNELGIDPSAYPSLVLRVPSRAQSLLQAPA